MEQQQPQQYWFAPGVLVHQPEARDPRCQNRYLPNVQIQLESNFVIIEATATLAEPALWINVVYIEPFPLRTRYQFRGKLVRDLEKWILYIVLWQPMNIDQQTIDFAVTVSAQIPASFNPVTMRHIPDSKTVTAYQVNINAAWNEWKAVVVLDRMPQQIKIEVKVPANGSSAAEVEQMPTLASLVTNDANNSLVELVGKDASKISVLQCVLENHSEVFRRMFAVEMKEKQNKTVSMEGLDAEDLQELKAYLYTLAEPKANFIEMFKMANMYEMEHLKECCTKQLIIDLTTENALDLLNLASVSCYQPLLNAVLLFCEEYRREVVCRANK